MVSNIRLKDKSSMLDSYECNSLYIFNALFTIVTLNSHFGALKLDTYDPLCLKHFFNL